MGARGARSISLVTRVARSAALAAAVSGLSAAVATSLLGGFLLREAEDRRLFEAARDLVFLLGDSSVHREQIVAIVPLQNIISTNAFLVSISSSEFTST